MVPLVRRHRLLGGCLCKSKSWMAGRRQRHHSEDQLLVERRASRPSSQTEPPSGEYCLPPPTATCYHRTRYENEKRQECNRLVLAREQKQSVVDTYRTHPTDTGLFLLDRKSTRLNSSHT